MPLCNILYFVLWQITRKMRKSLASLGYTEQDINKMTPSQATNAVNRCIQKSTIGQLSPESHMKHVERKD